MGPGGEAPGDDGIFVLILTFVFVGDVDLGRGGFLCELARRPRGNVDPFFHFLGGG